MDNIKNNQSEVAPTPLDRAALAKAVQQIARAVTNAHGADCILYAIIGAGAMQSLGYKAQAVAGHAAWRIGTGDGDVISHTPEIPGAVYAPTGEASGLFHCWIELDADNSSWVVDLSTWQLREKAELLDKLDGGCTSVEFCPPYIWVQKTSRALQSVKDVVQSFDHGVFSYKRHAELESGIFAPYMDGTQDSSIFGAVQAYKALLRGDELQVFGIGPDGVIGDRNRDPLIYSQI